MIPHEVARLFSAAIRGRGEEYHRTGRVHGLAITPRNVTARVRGTVTYDVEIGLAERDRIRISCDCPYAEDNYACKHLWAVLLAADEHGAFEHFRSARARSPRSPRPQQRERDPAAVPRVEPAWRERLQALHRVTNAQEVPPAAVEPLQQPLTYRLDLDHLRTTGEVMIDVVARGKNTFTEEQWLRSADASDRDVAHLLLGARPADSWKHDAAATRRFLIRPVLYETTLRRICDTGRCSTRSRDGDLQIADPISWLDGEPWQVHFAVRAGTVGVDAHWQLHATLHRGIERTRLEDALLITAHGLLVTAAGLCRVDIGDAWPLIHTLRTGGPITAPADQLFDLAAELVLLPGGAHVELPAGTTLERVHVEPTPQLRIEAPPHHWETDLPAKLRFTYDGVAAPKKRGTGALIDRRRRRIIQRSPALERAARERLLEAGAKQKYDWTTRRRELVVPPRKLEGLVLTLAAEGWRIEAHGRHIRVVTRTETRVRSGIDWFELDGDVVFGDVHARLPALLAALKRGEKTVVLDDGSHGILPTEWLRRYASAALLGAAADDDSPIRFSRSQAGLLDALLADQPEVAVDEVFTRIRDELRTFTAVSAEEPPPGFAGVLRAYQKEGLGWMTFPPAARHWRLPRR